MRRAITLDPREEARFGQADRELEALVPRLSAHVRRSYLSIVASEDFAAGAFWGSAGGVVAFDRFRAALSERARTLALEREALLDPADQEPQPVEKALKREALGHIGKQEAALIDEAVETGVRLALRGLPKELTEELDLGAARSTARARLRKAGFRRALRELDDARAGLERLMRAGRDPSMATLRDPEMLQRSFGLNERQAEAITRELARLLRSGESATKIRRELRRRIARAVDYRSEMIARSIANEALNAGEEAVLEQALAQGLLTRRMLREWVTREDRKVCKRCNRFNRKRAPIGGEFIADPDENGDRERSTETGIHPLCRCRTRYVFVKGALAARIQRRVEARLQRSKRRAA